MLYAPRSGGVKRYINAKRAWLARHRPQVRHTLVAPGPRDAHDGHGRVSIYAAPLPFGDGYRWPVSKLNWMERLIRQRPTLIEAGDPYTPGLAAQKAGQALGAPVVGFAHTDLGALAALHFGEWAEKPVRKKWAEIYNGFDLVLTPSCYMAERLADAGVADPVPLPLGVDTEIFEPSGADGAALRRRLGLEPRHRLLVYAGRPAKEKKLDVLVEAVERLGEPYRLLLVGGATGAPESPLVIGLPYERDARSLAALLASCDAFVHSNDTEPFGLAVIEAMACGLPVVGVRGGGVAETVDESVGQLADRSEGRAFAEAVDGLFQRDTQAVGQAARLKAAARHSWNAVFDRLTEIYARMTARQAFLAA